jgi:hypothetical protein
VTSDTREKPKVAASRVEVGKTFSKVVAKAKTSVSSTSVRSHESPKVSTDSEPKHSENPKVKPTSDPRSKNEPRPQNVVIPKMTESPQKRRKGNADSITASCPIPKVPRTGKLSLSLLDLLLCS